MKCKRRLLFFGFFLILINQPYAQSSKKLDLELDSILTLTRSPYIHKASGKMALDSATSVLISQLENFDNPEDKIKILMRICYFKRVVGENDSAFYFNERINTQIEKVPNAPPLLKFDYYVNRIIIEVNRDRVSEALRFLPIAIELASTDFQKSKIYNNSGRIYMALQDFKQAAWYYAKDYALMAKQKNDGRASHAAYHVGKNVDILFDSDSAWYWYDLTLQHDPTPIVKFQIKLLQADRISYKGNPRAGLDSLLQLTGLSNISNPHVHLLYWEILGEILAKGEKEIMERARVKYPNITHFVAYDSCVKIMSSIGLGHCEIEKLEGFANTFARSGDYARAYSVSKDINAYTSTQFETNIENNLLEQSRMERLLSEQAIDTKELEINQQKQVLYSLFALALVLILFIIYFYVNQRKLSHLNNRLALQNADISKQRQQIEIQSQQLIKLDEIKSRFFINISHELRTPLTLIMGTADHAIKGGYGKISERIRASLNTSLQNSQRLLRMINDILDLSKLEHGKLELKLSSVSLSKTIGRCTDIFRSKASNLNIRFVESIQDDLPLIALDAGKIESVVINLLGNALRHTPDGGTVTIALKGSPEGAQIQISDDGVGIPGKDLPYIFDRFYQVEDKQSSEGSGVGLTLSKEIIELHKGKISVQSQKNKGTHFTVLLPYRDIASEQDQSVSEQPKVSTRDWVGLEDPDLLNLTTLHEPGHYALLVVEDNQEMKKYIEDLLDSQYKLHFASNGQEALQLLDGLNVDLILTDYMMPVMNGLEFMKAVKSQAAYSDIPMIFLTARAESQDKLDVLKYGVDDYIIKPFLSEELKIRINNLLTLKKERNKSSLDEPEPQTAQEALYASSYTYIRQRLTDELLTIDSLAEHLSMSKRTLFRKMKALTGFTPDQYIKEIRLLEARKLLESRQKMSVSEVAFTVGFENLSHFSTSYKARFGRSPSDYLD